MLREFKLTAGAPLKSIASNKQQWRRRAHVKMIVIPVRIGESWMLY
jgi:hypothetical protein